MWTQLQGELSTGAHKPQSPDKQRKHQHRDSHTKADSGPELFSLQDAAIALQGSQYSQGPTRDEPLSESKVEQNTTNHEIKQQDQQGHGQMPGQKIDLNALFGSPQAMFDNQEKKDDKTKKKKAKDGQDAPESLQDPFNSANEFAEIFNALQVSESADKGQKQKKSDNPNGVSGFFVIY